MSSTWPSHPVSEGHWTQVGAIFGQAMELPTGERPQFLDDICADQGDLRREVESLLAAHARADREFLDEKQVARLVKESDEPLEAPSSIGPWRVLGEIGRGGMGVVYDVRREDGQFEQTAALKLTKHGLAGDRHLEHFLRERQILARMDHAGIARLLDGGVTPDGRPFFVLEKVDGEHLTQYCREKKLEIDDRLRLFSQVCAAVEYAHRNLIVHRDLKPSNVLVNTEGEVKLLDFGIAKILRNSENGEAKQSAATRLVGTPGYGAPEVLWGGTVTTATDVYSLGVILEELVRGRRPGEGPGPVAPDGDSAAMATSPETGLFADSAATVLDRDLETIAEKATQIEAESRYVSAEALREDIERYLRGEPVRACPDSLTYRAGKFLKRHRASALAASVALLSILVGLGAALWQADVASRERDIAREESEQAEQVKEFLIDLFRASSPEDVGGAELTAEEWLERGWERVRSDLQNRPDHLRVELLTTVGEVSTTLGGHEEARQLFEEAATIELEPSARNLLRLAAALNGLGMTASYLGDPETAIGHHRRALAIRREHTDGENLDLTETLNNLGVALAMEGRLAEAIDVYVEATEIQERVAGPGAQPTLDTLGNLGLAYRYQGDFLQAEKLLATVVERMAAQGRGRDPKMVHFLAYLASIQSRLGKFQEAHLLRGQSFELSKAFWGESHPDTRLAMNNRAISLHNLGFQAEAEELMRQALEYDVEQFGPDHAYVALGRDNLGSILLELGRLDEAIEQFELSEALFEKSPSFRNRFVHQIRWAHARLAVGQISGARELADLALESQRRQTPPNNQGLTNSLLVSGFVQTAQGLHTEAETLFLEALASIKERVAPHHPDLGIAYFGLGELYLRSDRVDEAREVLEQASKHWAIGLPAGHWRREEAKLALGECEWRTGDEQRGRQLMDEAIGRLSQDLGEGHWRTLKAIDRLVAFSAERFGALPRGAA